MYLALNVNPFSDTDLLFVQQLGVQSVVADMPTWDLASLSAARNRVEQAGLHLVASASLPTSLCARAILGRAGRDEEIEKICQHIADLGQVGLPLLSYRWTVADAEQSPHLAVGRGGASSAAYEMAKDGPGAGAQITPDQVWQNLAYFLERVLPAAEAAGVRLAYQAGIPTDFVSGRPAILHSVAGLDRLFAAFPSPNHGLDLDHGLFAWAPDTDPCQIIRHLGREGRIWAVCARKVQRVADGWQEHFLDEDRAMLLGALQAYQEIGFEGPLRPATPPAMTDDTAWGHKGQAFHIGYLRALLQAIG